MPRRLVSLLLSLAVAGAGALVAHPAAASVCSQTYGLSGVDVSHFQGTIDWAAVRAAGTGFAYVRVSEGSDVDPLAAQNLAGARAAGIPVGGYAFALPGNDPVADAQTFLANADAHAGDLAPVLDVETTGGQSPQGIQSYIGTWLTTVSNALGVLPGIYTSPGWWNGNVGSTAFRQYPLWTANWGVSCPSVAMGWSTWAFWQNADSGHVSGIPMTVDLDRSWSQDLSAVTIQRVPRASFIPAAAQPVPAGALATLTLGTFTTKDGSAFDSSATAAIDWGDGTSSAAALQLSGSTATVAGSHAFADAGSRLATVTLNDSAGFAGRGAVLVTSFWRASFTASWPSFVEGALSTPALGRFTMAGGIPSDATASIDWGDGTSGAGTVGADGTVSGRHAYADKSGQGPISVTLSDGAGVLGKGMTWPAIFEAPLTGHALTLGAPAGFAGSVATFNDANSLSTPADLSATIYWDEYTYQGPMAVPVHTPGTVTGGGGSFSVQGSYNFTRLGPHSVTVYVYDDSSLAATITSSVLVYAFPTGGSFVISKGAAVAGQPATFWGARWAADNPLASGRPPAEFKGWESGGASPVAGDTWSAGAGASAVPPASLPAYMGVAVTDSVARSPQGVTGNVVGIAVVQPAGGYSPALDAGGTGAVVAVYPGG